MALPKYVEIDGKRIAWRDLLRLRREQRKAAQRSQLTLFEMRDDTRPKSQRSAAGRFSEPTLFDE
jgi:hypothetical protein